MLLNTTMNSLVLTTEALLPTEIPLPDNILEVEEINLDEKMGFFAIPSPCVLKFWNPATGYAPFLNKTTSPIEVFQNSHRR